MGRHKVEVTCGLCGKKSLIYPGRLKLGDKILCSHCNSSDLFLDVSKMEQSKIPKFLDRTFCDLFSKS